MKKILFIIILAFMISGCADQSSTMDDGQTRQGSNEWERPHFISTYFIPHELEVGTTIVPTYFYIIAFGEKHNTYDLTKELSDEAKYFIELYGDNKLKGNTKRGYHEAMAYPIDWITISCDKDFDAEHPAGEPLLGDVVQLEYRTYYNFVKSGLTAYNYSQNGDPEVDRYKLGFDKVNADITKLMRYGAASSSIAGIRFQYAPEVADKYTFTITAEINGEVMTTSFTTTFE